MDAAHDELRDSEICTDILRHWSNLDPAFRDAMLADYGIDRLSMLSLWTLDSAQRENLLIAILRRTTGRPVITAVDLTDNERLRRPASDPWSYGRMGWSPGCESA
ncbi:hypothetical protein [Mycobacterium sp. AT1]|uniref:hypothetical protein n=1 Tax=Mycobacterium sp. AT1 TaxID=1961706 RepID=UPI0009AF1134|nr:hypothetical protein [Mycobacterium sp. AT1]OPX12969.1 hypothetical protein B1790_01955 [Mycobacterium sp. AT1]